MAKVRQVYALFAQHIVLKKYESVPEKIANAVTYNGQRKYQLSDLTTSGKW